MILPLSLMTEWYWSGSLAAFARAANLRLADSSQKETQLIAQQISNITAKHFPVSWKYLLLSKWSNDD